MPVEVITEAYQAGHKIFGENKVQELVFKHPLLPEDIEWHFIGHLQSNKVKAVAPLVKLIHSVDSEKLLRLIDAEGNRLGRSIDCLLQIRIAHEETKFGMHADEATQLCRAYLDRQYHHVRIRGLMGMATFTNDMQIIRDEFAFLADYYHELKQTIFPHDHAFAELSIGMSGDFEIAIRAGATIIRIGSLIFGERNH